MPNSINIILKIQFGFGLLFRIQSVSYTEKYLHTQTDVLFLVAVA